MRTAGFFPLLRTMLGVEQGEVRSVSLMVAHSFFIGGTTVFFETAASATFLARFDARLLPWVYVAAAVTSLGAGLAYARLQHRTSFAALMRGTLGVVLLLALGLRLGFATSHAPWLAFAGLVAYRLVSSLTDLEYWAVASRLYDVGQAKRLFGLVGTGEVTARLLGSIAVPLVVRSIGVPNLLLLSAGAVGACLVLLEATLGDAPVESAIAVEPPSWRRGTFALLADPYVVTVVTVAVLATFGKFFVDFGFLRQIAGRSETELAVFLGWFGAGTQLVSLLLRVLVSRPLLERFGVRAGVLVLPVLHALCTALIFVAPAHAPFFVIGNQALYKSLKHPIDNASFKVLYQPLGPRQRLGAQLLVEIFFVPAIAATSGVVMLAFGRHYDVFGFSVVLLVTFGLWIAAGRRAGRRYDAVLSEDLPGSPHPARRARA